MANTNTNTNTNANEEATPRPTPLIENPVETAKKLEEWFNQLIETDGGVSISELTIPEGSGMSNVTLLFDLQYKCRGEAIIRPCVARMQPNIERPVFPHYDLSLQYKVMDLIAKQFTGIPVPAMLGLETNKHVLGTTFYVMARISGRVAADMMPYTMEGWFLDDADPVQRRLMWNNGIDMMASFHRQALTRLNEFDFIDAPPQGKTALQAQLDYWQQYLAWAMEGRGHKLGEQVLNWLRENQPTGETVSVCWGDSRLGNLMYSPLNEDIVAMLDWEMMHFGNPLQDVGWWCYMDRFFSEGLGINRVEGLPESSESVQRWADASGFSGEHFKYYELFAALRYGLIMGRITLNVGNPEEIENNTATMLLQRVFEECIGA